MEKKLFYNALNFQVIKKTIAKAIRIHMNFSNSYFHKTHFQNTYMTRQEKLQPVISTGNTFISTGYFKYYFNRLFQILFQPAREEI